MANVLTEPPKSNSMVDARGSACPGPLMETKKAISKVKKGEILEIWSSDAGSREDIPTWVNFAKHEYLGYVEDSGYDRHFVKRMK